jgi:hypothetical protein
MAALKTRCVGNFSRRTVENIVCKEFRRYTKNQSDALFNNILLPKQNLYWVNQDQVQVMAAHGKYAKKTKHLLLHMGWLSMAGISL